MESLFRNRKGSITIIAIYIFMIMISSTTMLLYFASIQSALSKNQLEKVQSRYNSERDLNNLIYNRDNIEKYIKQELLRRHRSNFQSSYRIDFKKDDELKKTIEKGSFEVRNVSGRDIVSFEIVSNYDGRVSSIVAYGPYVNNIFKLNKSFLSEDSLSDLDNEKFLDFISRMEKENWDYDLKTTSTVKKINTENSSDLKLITESSSLSSRKRFTVNSGLANEKIIDFDSQPIIFHLKREDREDIEKKILNIGSLEDEGSIKMTGVLYLEGDLIINQDFAFEGLIIMNKGEIIVNPGKALNIRGMLLSKESLVDRDSIKLIYDQKIIDRNASYLPGFIDIDIEVIKNIE